METTLLVSSVLLWLAVFFNLFLTFALIRRSNVSAHAGKPVFHGGLERGTEAPDFAAHTLSGETKTLASYRGRRTAFVFFSAHCQPCRDLLSQLKRIEAKIRQANVDLVLISGDEREETEAIVTEMDIQFPLLIAPRTSNPFFDDYKIVNTPSHCFINPQGIVQASGLPVVQSGQWKALTEVWDKDEAYALSERR